MAATVLLMLHSRATIAQETPALRPYLAYEIGVPLTLERSPGAVDWCSTCTGTGTSLNHTVRVGTALSIPRALLASLDVDTRLTLSLSSGEFVSDPYAAPLVNPNTNETQQVQQQFTVTAFTASATLDLLMKKELWNGVAATFGPWGDYRVLSRFVQTEQLLAPESAQFFDDSTRHRIVAEGEILGSSSLSGGVLFGLSTAIPLSSQVQVVPELYTRVDGWGVLNGLGFRALNSGLGLSLRVQPPKERPVPPQFMMPAPQPPPAPPIPILSAQIDLYAINNNHRSDTGTLRPSTTLIRYHRPVAKEILLRNFIVPEIGVAPQITAGAGVLWWGLSIRRGETEIARITSQDPAQSVDIDIQVIEGEELPTLTAELIVQDSTERIVGARDQLVFVKEAAPGRPTDTTTLPHNATEDQWVFPLPLPSTTTPFDWLRPVLDSANTEGTVITIAPTNTYSFNMDQATRTMDSIAAHLRTASTAIVNIEKSVERQQTTRLPLLEPAILIRVRRSTMDSDTQQ